MWLIFSGDCISSNLGLSLIIHLQGKHWTTMLMPNINGICFFTIIAGKTLAVTKRLEEKFFFITSDLSGLFAHICCNTYDRYFFRNDMTNWLHFCRAQLTSRNVLKKKISPCSSIPMFSPLFCLYYQYNIWGGLRDPTLLKYNSLFCYCLYLPEALSEQVLLPCSFQNLIQ